jgi:hypothetical protein
VAVVLASLRYTIDKTTREVLFLPLPADLKYRAKPFVDVTVDRSAKAVGALLVLVLIKPWGFGIGWQGLSAASLVVMAIWIVMAMRARREYLKAFRSSIQTGRIQAEALHLDVTDASTIELLVEELAHADPLVSCTPSTCSKCSANATWSLHSCYTTNRAPFALGLWQPSSRRPRCLSAGRRLFIEC